MNPLTQVNEQRRQEAERRTWAAIEQLRAAGQPVTVRAIRRISSGSFSTILKVLQEDRRERAEQIMQRSGEPFGAWVLRYLDALKNG